jgi:hypothetical protein
MPPTHLSRFAVRSPCPSGEDFLVWFAERLAFGLPRLLGIPASIPKDPRGFHAASPTQRALLVPASPPVHRDTVVSEYQPIVHRLRRDAYGLGPTNPTRMFLPSETLGLRRTRFSRALSLLIPAFALRNTPGALPGLPSPRPNAPLPLARGKSTVSVRGLSPDPLSARGHSTSELLRTLSRMAASKPTSWLFGRPHIL